MLAFPTRPQLKLSEQMKKEKKNVIFEPLSAGKILQDAEVALLNMSCPYGLCVAPPLLFSATGCCFS